MLSARSAPRRLLVGPVAVGVAMAVLTLQGGYAAGDEEEALSALRKIQKLSDGSVAGGRSVEFTDAEMTAFVRIYGATALPEGIHDPKLEFRDGGALIHARIDLEKAGASAGELPALMRLLLRGTREVVLDVEFSASDGYASSELVAVTIDGVEVPPVMLTWLLESYAPKELRPYLLGEDAKLSEGVRAIALFSGRAVVEAD